jgi:hypothetical protein
MGEADTLVVVDTKRSASISPLRHRWSRIWPPVVIAFALAANAAWMSLLAYLIYSFV